MKNKVKYCLLFFIILVVLFPLKIYSEENIPEYSDEKSNADYGQSQIIDALPDDLRDKLEESDITPDNSGALALSVEDVFGFIWDSFNKEITKPLTMLISLVGVVLLCAVIEALRDSTGSSTAIKTFNVVGVLAGAGMMCVYISECVVRTSSTLKAGGTFLVTFIPVFAGIMAVCGQLTTAPVFNSIIIIAAQVFSHIMILVLMPLSSCILGVSAAGAVNPDLKVERIAELVKKIVIWILGILVTVFVGMLSLQSFVTNAADTVAMKATKFAVSNAVPIVGGAISDALMTVKGSLGLLRSSTGTFGIIAGLGILLPAVISVVCYKIALGIAGAISDLFGISQLTSLLKSGENVVTIILAMLSCFALLAVISIALMLVMGLGGTA